MVEVIPSGEILGARVVGLDLSQPLSDRALGIVLRALADHAVLCFPGQRLDAGAQVAFSRRFGALEVHVSGAFQDPAHPEVMTLSNITENGRPIGLADAGQDWHTDMSFSRMIAFVNVLYALKVPRRDGKALGNTEFASMTAAYEALPSAMKTRLEGLTATHDFEKFWEMMRRRKGAATGRAPLTEEQRRKKPPVSHPMVMKHPISGRRILYANPGYTMRVDGLPPDESDALLEYLFEHQVRPEFVYAHRWNEGDVLVWDNLQTLHNAIDDYGPDEPRLIKRCQAMANLVFEPRFARLAAGAAG
ncbi:MAG TPA: TauD/TfdA family dioxygenase [Stellaceae bacterium]|nr:TauD/TfdA family dioxygenase [Stellaceae bacterium]